MSQTQAVTHREVLCSLAMGVAGEAGEVSEVVKKHLFHGKYTEEEFDEKLKSELGDVLWYLTRLADERGWSLEDLFASNVKKLSARYPQGLPPDTFDVQTLPDTPVSIRAEVSNAPGRPDK